MAASDLACVLLVFHHLIPRAEIFGLTITMAKVMSIIIPMISAMMPKVISVLTLLSKSQNT